MSRRFLGGLIAIVAAAQLWLAYRYFGFLTGDDLEVLAEGFHRALRFPYRPWDIRCLFVPDVFVAPAVGAASLIGFESTRVLAFAASLPFIALTAVTIVLVHRLTLEWTEGDELAAHFAVVLFALHWMPLGFGATVYPRTLATACIVGAALLAQRRPFLAGALVGIAFADRFSEIIFLIPILLVAATPLKNAAKVAAATLLTIAIVCGFYDWLTWGEPFGSVIRFARLTLLEPDFASRVKYQAPWWYLANIARWCAPTMLPLFWVGRKRAPWAFIVIPLMALSAIRHKEARYLQAIVPFLAIAAAIGAAMLWRERRRLAIALLVLSIGWNLAGLRTFARKSMPAVQAAEMLGADPSVGTVALTQLWAYGDRLYFGGRMQVRDVGTPLEPIRFAWSLQGADAVALFETDLEEPILAPLRREGFVAVKTFRDGPARAVVVFRRPR